MLYKRIDSRVDKMIEDGLEAEVAGLLKKGYGPDLKPMQSIGYRHMSEYILNRIGLAETVETIKRDTRRFSKRQYTWLRSQPGIQWFRPDTMEPLFQSLNRFFQENNSISIGHG